MSLKRDRLAALNDEDLTDVWVVGTDGEEIACNKAFLAAASPVFKRMFFRGFREQTADHCRLGYHSVVIAAIVKYCYCDELDFDSILLQNENNPLLVSAALLIDLRDAGRYLELGRVSFEVERKIIDLVVGKKKYRCIGLFLTELLNRGEDETPFWDLLFMLAVDRPLHCFGSGVSEEHPGTDAISQSSYDVNPTILAKVLDKVLDRYTVVRCLQTWAETENDSDDSDDSDDSGDSGDTEGKQALLKIARGINLKTMSLSQLSAIGKAKPSSLFPMERIFEAFVNHGGISRMVPSLPKLSADSSYHVYGAGVECVNGRYRMVQQHPPERQMFEKAGEYHGSSCYFRIHLKRNKWLLSVYTRRVFLIGRLCDLYQQDREYDNTRVPYGQWECMQDGVEPSPIVLRL